MKFNAPRAIQIPGATTSNIVILTIVDVITIFAPKFLIPQPPRATPAPPPVLEPHQNHVNHALNRVTADPQPDRRVRLLLEGATDHHHRDHHERHVPRHVERHHRLRVSPVSTALLQLARRSLADHHGGAATATAEEEGEDGSACGGIVAGTKEGRVGLGGGIL